MSIFRFELQSLTESHILVIPLAILSFTQLLPIPPPLIFDLFAKDDEAPPIGAKRGYKEEDLGNPDMEFQWALKMATCESRLKHTIDK